MTEIQWTDPEAAAHLAARRKLRDLYEARSKETALDAMVLLLDHPEAVSAIKHEFRPEVARRNTLLMYQERADNGCAHSKKLLALLQPAQRVALTNDFMQAVCEGVQLAGRVEQSHADWLELSRDVEQNELLPQAPLPMLPPGRVLDYKRLSQPGTRNAIPLAGHQEHRSAMGYGKIQRGVQAAPEQAEPFGSPASHRGVKPR
jgi:hypothetical protein